MWAFSVEQTPNFQKLYSADPGLDFYDMYFLLLNVTIKTILLHILINCKLSVKTMIDSSVCGLQRASSVMKTWADTAHLHLENTHFEQQ